MQSLIINETKKLAKYKNYTKAKNLLFVPLPSELHQAKPLLHRTCTFNAVFDIYDTQL